MAAASPKAFNILALDVGTARVGVALANTIAKMPSPLVILENNEQIFEELKSIIEEEDIATVVIGLPRNMKGEETEQSEVSRNFAGRLKKKINQEIVFADESLSTKRAETSRYVKGKDPRRGKHLDDVAACFILEEYFSQESTVNG